ncbi:hypothetical protein [Novosphingobium sp. B 225]|uniref:hypothetical protein n=1 Tax=Novosphingobium sp. B 225 TaxID=1961849 RepID=UPI000B4AF934|nr:hypothetical protein [Novosphingobium sp. B 225]
MALPQFALTDPEWLAHRHLEGQDRVRFIHVPRSDHRRVPFLTDEYLGAARAQDERGVAQCLDEVAPRRMGFLFHSAFCGSTMLLSALDQPGVAMGLSEPVLLNDLVGFRRRGAQPAAVARLADGATRLLARPFEPQELAVVKPSNVLNPLAELLLALRADSNAILLHAPLETFLISVVRKGLWCRLWVRELLEGLLTDRAVDLGFTPQDYFRQSDLQIAAIGWLAQHALFQRLAAKLGPGRIRTLDSEVLTARPADVLRAATRHYQLQADPAQLAAMAGSPVFSRHSKSGERFDSARRGIEYAEARAAHGDEIGKVTLWAAEVARAAGIAMELPHPLIA